MPRPLAKRAAALAFINASYMYPQTESGAQPNRRFPRSVDCATAGLAIIMAVAMSIMLGRLNRKLDKGEHVDGAINAVPGEAQERGFGYLV